MQFFAAVDTQQTIVNILGSLCVGLLLALITVVIGNNRARHKMESDLRKAQESERNATNRLCDVMKKQEFLMAKHGQDIKRKEEEIGNLHKEIAKLKEELEFELAAAEANRSGGSGS